MWYVVEFTDANPEDLSIYAFAALGLKGVIGGLEYYAQFHEFATVHLYDNPDQTGA